MSEYANFFITIISSAGVSALFCVALIWLCRSWIGERIKASIKHEYDQQLAELNAQLKIDADENAAKLKGAIDREADKLKLASQSFGEIQKVVIVKRLAAIEATWDGVLALQGAVPPALSYFDILLKEEYATVLQSDSFATALKKLDHHPIVMAAFDRNNALSHQRPYIGEYLWGLYVTYVAVIMRAVYLIDESKKESTKLIWYKDSLIRQHLESAFGKAALIEFDSKEIGLVNWIHYKFTHAILAAMDGVIAGRAFSEAALRQAELMEIQITETAKSMFSVNQN